MLRLGIRQKVLLTFAAIVLIGGTAVFLIAGLEVRDVTLEFYQQDLEMSALNLANVVVDALDEDNSGTLQTLLDRAHARENQTFTLLDTQRRVLASTSDFSYTKNTPLSETPELLDAAEGNRGHAIRTGENGEDFAFVAVPVTYEGRLIGIVRTEAPMSPAYRDVRRKWYELAAVAVPVSLLTLAASFWLGGTLTRPIRQLHTSALRIAEGHLDERVTIRSGDEIGHLAQAFNYMAERVNTLLSTQRSFVSSAAHELRAPLMSLKLRVEALQERSLPDAQRTAYLNELTQEIDHLSSLITQLLILARLDEGRHQADTPPSDPVAFFTDLARSWRIRARTAEITFDAALPNQLPPLALTASDVQIVVDNLLSNAFKYTPAGGTVELRVTHDHAMLRIAVRDNGEGFPPDEKSQLFERFYRSPRARSHTVFGTGLGLSIVKAVVDEYGGTITAHSDGPDRGAAFEVALSVNRSAVR